MNIENIESAVINIYVNYVSDEWRERISIETKMEEMEIRSVDFIRIIIDIENAFNFEFDDDELQPHYYHTIQDMVSFIENKTKCCDNQS